MQNKYEIYLEASQLNFVVLHINKIIKLVYKNDEN